MASSARGLRLMKAIEIMTKINPPRFDNQLFDKIKFTSISNGVVKGSVVIDPSMCNVGDVLHGGYIAAVVDILAHYGQLSNPGGRISLTTTMSINYCAVAKLGEKLLLETKSLKGGFNPITETFLYNEQGELVAKGTNSFRGIDDKYQKFLKGFDVFED